MILDTPTTRLKTEIAHSLVLTIPLSQIKPATTAINILLDTFDSQTQVAGSSIQET
jgi:hypothetical protein